MKDIFHIISFIVLIALFPVSDAVSQDLEQVDECVNRLQLDSQGISYSYDPDCMGFFTNYLGKHDSDNPLYRRPNELNGDCVWPDDCDNSSGPSGGLKEAKYVYIETEKPQPVYSLHAKRFIFSAKTDVYADKLEIISVQSFDEIPPNDLKKYRNEGNHSDVIVLDGNASVKVHSLRHREGYYGGIGIDQGMMKYLYLQKYPDETVRFRGSKKVYIVGQVTEYAGPNQYDRTESFHEVVELREQEYKRSIHPIVLPYGFDKLFGGATRYTRSHDRYSPPLYKAPTYRFVPRR